MPQYLRTIITAYADDVTVFVNDNNDIKALSKVIDIYEGASSAKVNWDKTEAFWSGQRNLENLPHLPGNLKWNRTGIKILGVFWVLLSFKRKIGREFWRECAPDCLDGTGCYPSYPTGGEF